jgi:small-conductance mechanosensitive channel
MGWWEDTLGISLSQLLSLLVIAAVAIILERVITRYLSRVARRARLAPNVANTSVLTFRLLILLGAVAAVIRVGGLPTE